MHPALVPPDVSVIREGLLGVVCAVLLLGWELRQASVWWAADWCVPRLCAQAWGLGRRPGASVLGEAQAPSRTP